MRGTAVGLGSHPGRRSGGVGTLVTDGHTRIAGMRSIVWRAAEISVPRVGYVPGRDCLRSRGPPGGTIVARLHTGSVMRRGRARTVVGRLATDILRGRPVARAVVRRLSAHPVVRRRFVRGVSRGTLTGPVVARP
ncbi:hypothetical protein, partial [Nocardia mexicana]|uniref:hypothetical protein n=1 Tax=Nocardia mexicana TaxID=279262 RepID=UPI0012F4E6B3